jgi:hypothetical protein
VLSLFSLGEIAVITRRIRRAVERFRERLIIAFATLGAEREYERARSEWPERKIDEVFVYGSERFANDCAATLLVLRDDYPYGYSLVQRYVRAIVQSDLKAEIGALIGVQYDRPNAEGRIPISTKRYAAYLVRLAAGIRLSRFLFSRSSRTELLVYRQELKAMRTVQCEPEYFHRASNEVLKRERELRQHGVKVVNRSFT